MAGMEKVTASVDRAGRLLIPAIFRKKMGLMAGAEVVLDYDEGMLRVFTREQALRKAQDLVAGLAPRKTSLSRELIADRRREVRRERQD